MRLSAQTLSVDAKVEANSVRAVLFDLGNTLVSYYRAQDFTPILRESITGISEFLSEQTSIAVDPDRAFRHALRLNIEDSNFRVRLLQDRLLEIFRDVPLTTDTYREISRIFLSPIFRCAMLDPEALPTLAAIRQDGIRTAIVSNTPWGSPAEQWADELDRHGLNSAVDAVVFCVDVGWRKPAPQIFEHALSLIRVEAPEAAFVGDDPHWDISGAEQVGLRPILLDPRAKSTSGSVQCIRSLKELLPLLHTGAV